MLSFRVISVKVDGVNESFEYSYDDEKGNPLTHGRMLVLDRDLRTMKITDEEIEACLSETEPMTSDEKLKIFGE